MPPRKKNLHKRKTVKVPYASLYTHKTAEERPIEPGEREENIRELELQAHLPSRKARLPFPKTRGAARRKPEIYRPAVRKRSR